jgi:D-alanyl-D-alanine carboxypeptidase
MKQKHKKNEFESDFENSELDALNEEIDDLKKLSKAERKMLRAAKRKGVDRSTLDPYDQSDKAEFKRYAKKHKATVAIVSITIALLLAIIGTVVAILIIRQQGKPSSANYEVTVGEDKPYTLSYKEANSYGQFYFDLCSIAKYSDLVVSGSEGRVKFTCPDGTYVRFVNDSATATVNGDAVKVGGKVKIIPSTEKEEGKCLVPFKFIEKLFSHKADGNSVGMVAKVSSKNKVTIHRISYSNGSQPPISFASECFDYADDMQISSYPNPNIDARTASAICVSKLYLVNKSNPMREEEITTNGLVSLKSLNCPTVDGLEDYDSKDFFDPTAALALIAMINEANKTLEGGDKILVSSAYRSFSYQEGLHEKYIDNYMDEHDVSEEEAREQTLLTSAPAGKSEHHSGLCVDLVESRAAQRELDETFEDTEAFAWLSQNAHKYGFILRYPKDKTDITKYSYEPWHYRFVGVYAATIIYEDNITLEEYLADFE